MDIILKPKLVNGIGINTGNNIMNFLFKKNDNIPSKNKFQYIIDIKNKDYHILELYFGNNLTSNNNVLFYKKSLPTNIYINIFGSIIYNILFIEISSKLTIYDKISFKINNNNIIYTHINNEYIQRLELYHKLYICIENIKYNLQFLNINSNIKKSIEEKLVNFYNIKHTYENLQLMNKISELKVKFNLDFNSI